VTDYLNTFVFVCECVSVCVCVCVCSMLYVRVRASSILLPKYKIKCVMPHCLCLCAYVCERGIINNETTHISMPYTNTNLLYTPQHVCLVALALFTPTRTITITNSTHNKKEHTQTERPACVSSYHHCLHAVGFAMVHTYTQACTHSK